MYNLLGEVYRISYGDLCFLKRHLPETVVSSLVGPLLYLVAFAYGMRAGDTEAGVSYVAYSIPGIVAMTSMTAGFTSSAQKIMIQRLFHTSFDEMILCPMHTPSVVFGKSVVGMVRGLIGCAVLIAIGCVLTPEIFLSAGLVLGVLLSCVTFALLGVAAGLLARSSATLNLFSSLVVLPMTFLCGTLFSVDALPDAVGYVVWALPLTHSSEVIRSAALGWDVPWVSVAVVVLYLVAFYALDWYIIKRKLYRGAPRTASSGFESHSPSRSFRRIPVTPSSRPTSCRYTISVPPSLTLLLVPGSSPSFAGISTSVWYPGDTNIGTTTSLA